MSTYLFSTGIEFWENTEINPSEEFATLTLLDDSFKSISSSWLGILKSISATWPQAYKWHTLGYSLEQSKSQEYLLLKKIQVDYTVNDIIEKNSNTGIISSVQNVTEKLVELNLSQLAQPKFTTLIFSKNPVFNVRKIWDFLKNADAYLSINYVCEFLRFKNDTFLCRFVETETHVAIQFIGYKAEILLLQQIFSKLDITRIYDNQVSAFINNEQ